MSATKRSCCSRASAKSAPFLFRRFTNALITPIPTCKTGGQRVLSMARSVMRRASFYSLVLHLACTSSLWAQGAFTNLDFESASLESPLWDP